MRWPTLFWCLSTETNMLSLMFSLFVLPGEEEATGLKLKTSWSVEKWDQWEECSPSFWRKAPETAPPGPRAMENCACFKLTQKHNRHFYHAKDDLIQFLFYLFYMSLLKSLLQRLKISLIGSWYCSAGALAEGFGVWLSLLYGLYVPLQDR